MLRSASHLSSAAAAIAVAVVIAGCGSSSPGTSSTSESRGPLTQAQAQQFQQDIVRFAACMRTHGVPSFPDPSSPQEFKLSLGGQRSPAFDSAATACQHLLPGGGPRSQSAVRSRAQIDAELAFARCMRSHRFPNFPDPSTTGELSHEMLAAAGIDVHLPAVVQAADACVGVTHGFLTRAAVARFAAGQ